MIIIIFTFGTDLNRPPLNFSLSGSVDQILLNARDERSSLTATRLARKRCSRTS